MIDYSELTARELLSCMALGKALTSELRSEELFSIILHKISEFLPAENWSLLLLDEAAGELRFEVSVNLNLEQVNNVCLPLGQGIAGKVALEQTPMVVDNTIKCEFFSPRVDQITGCCTRSIICVPLIFGGKTVGVIEVVNPKSLKGDPLPLLSIIADYAAIAVENMRRYREIQNLASHDDLTGLYNTRHLYRVLGSLVRTAEETRGTFSLIFMDIDHFKKVVDTYGHLKGSQAIQEVAGTIRECLSEPSFGVAYGGDEFVAVLQGFDKAQALKKAEEIRSRMKQTIYLASQGHLLRLNASFGIATFPDDADDVTGLLALADRAMFNVKEGGKDAIKLA
ncbi:MAG: sensor domain-containing diguanylate cyclase [Pseudomonadota bacterium]